MKEFIVFGDYKNHTCPREDFKIFDFVLAETPKEAIQKWKESVEGDLNELLALIEDEVCVMSVEGTRWVFDAESDTLSQRYRRQDIEGLTGTRSM